MTRVNPQPARPRRWADVPQAAAYGAYSIRQLRTFIADGLVPAYRVGIAGNLKVDLNDIDSLIESGGPVQTASRVPTERERRSGRFTRGGAA